MTAVTRLLAPVVVLTLALAGCSSDDESPATASSSATVASAVSAPAAASSSTAVPAEASAPMTATSAADAASSAAPEPSTDTSSAAPAESTSAPASPAAAPAGGAGKGIKPCDLLTEAEVSDAVGAKVTAVATEQGEPLGGMQCTWTSMSIPIKNYSIALTRTDGMMKALVDAGQSAKTLYNDSKKLFNASEAVPGIGDEAVIVKSSIYALKGDVFIIASTIFGTSPKAKAALRSLTEKAVGKL